MNLYYGITEHQTVAWVMLQYLMNVPQRTFKNNCDQGLFHNTKQSIYALFHIPGFESRNENENQDKDESSLLNQEISQQDSLSFPKLQQNKKYVVNWARAFIYVIPQMPNHPLRSNVMKIMQQDQPRMIQNYKLMKSFKKEVERQNPQFNEMQKNQKAMLKMQQHFMNNGSPMKPSPEQQKIIQLQMLGHLKNQFKNDEALFNQFEGVENKLKKGDIDPEQASILLKQIQHKIMKIKMGEVLQQQQKQQNKTNQENDGNQHQSKQNDLLQESEKQSPQTEKNQSKFVLNQNSNNNVQPMMMPQVQQKQMMLMALSNMKISFKDDQAMFNQLDTIQTGLKNDTLSIEAAGVSMRSIQQQIMQKRMQQMANGSQPQNPMMHQPPPEQQRAMILMSIGQMKNRFSSNEQLLNQLSQIQMNLQEQRISLDQAKIAMSGIQQQIMRIMMNQNSMGQQNETTIKKQDNQQN